MTVNDGIDFLSQLDLAGIVLFFWHTIIFEVPRYLLGGFITAGATLFGRARPTAAPTEQALTVSVVVAGHNEARLLPHCIASIREQTIAGDPGRCQIIVVDDGSTDDMSGVAARLQAEGQIDVALSSHRRGGKSAAVNLGMEYATGDILIIADVDTSFDRHAFEAMVEPFADPTVGAVAGNLGVRNAGASVITHSQAVEYLIGVSLGRRLLSLFNTLFIVSGAFGAFRREAVVAVGGQSVEVGEDADLSAKLRRAGWKVRFAPEAWSLTDAPETMPDLIRQRMRWDRSTVTLWVRKFRSVFDPRNANFSLLDVLGALDILFFQIGLSATFVVYLVWLFWYAGSFAWVILMATMVVYIVFAAFSALAAVAVSGPYGSLRLLPYVPAYAVLNAYPLRFARLAAYLDELVFRRSYRDPYVPRRVMDQVERF